MRILKERWSPPDPDTLSMHWDLSKCGLKGRFWCGVGIIQVKIILIHSSNHCIQTNKSSNLVYHTLLSYLTCLNARAFTCECQQDKSMRAHYFLLECPAGLFSPPGKQVRIIWSVRLSRRSALQENSLNQQSRGQKVNQYFKVFLVPPSPWLWEVFRMVGSINVTAFRQYSGIDFSTQVLNLLCFLWRLHWRRLMKAEKYLKATVC